MKNHSKLLLLKQRCHQVKSVNLMKLPVGRLMIILCLWLIALSRRRITTIGPVHSHTGRRVHQPKLAGPRPLSNTPAPR